MSKLVGDILKSATIVPSDCPLQEAVRLMTSENRDRVYVTDRVGHVSSVVCDFVLLKALIRGESSDINVGQLAAPLQDRLMPTQPLEEAAVSFRLGFRTQLPVFENGQFLGIIERTSLLAALVQENLTPCDHDSETNRGTGLSVVSALNGLLNQQSLKTG
jgi:signal-transduction protein with cAMP-binding, CBS, and nucleotidyltransferase domain